MHQIRGGGAYSVPRPGLRGPTSKGKEGGEMSHLCRGDKIIKGPKLTRHKH